MYKKFKSMVEIQSGQKIKTLKTDDGCEYVSNEFISLCDKEILFHDVVSSYAPKKKGPAEKKNITIMNMVKNVLKRKPFLK